MSLIKNINATPAAKISILHNAHLRAKPKNQHLRRRSWM
jgi:hypothetical protein